MRLFSPPRYCVHCGYRLPRAAALRCPRCQKLLKSLMAKPVPVCPSCAAPLPSGVPLCPYCLMPAPPGELAVEAG